MLNVLLFITDVCNNITEFMFCCLCWSVILLCLVSALMLYIVFVSLSLLNVVYENYSFQSSITKPFKPLYNSSQSCHIRINFICLMVMKCQPWRSCGNMLASRSKVRRFKPGWGRWIFQNVKILSTSPPGSRVWHFRLVKGSQAWKNRPLSKI